MNPEDFFNGLPTNPKISFAEAIVHVLKDKYIEIFMGDVYEQMNQVDFDINSFAVIYGKVISGYGDCLLIDSLYYDEQSKELRPGNLIFINTFSVKAVTPFDNSGSLLHSIISSRHLRKHKIIKKKI